MAETTIVEACPVCGADGIPMLYGLPTHYAQVAADEGKLRLAGCVVRGPDEQQWVCTADERHEWTDAPGWMAAIDAILDDYENRS